LVTTNWILLYSELISTYVVMKSFIQSQFLSRYQDVGITQNDVF